MVIVLSVLIEKLVIRLIDRIAAKYSSAGGEEQARQEGEEA